MRMELNRLMALFTHDGKGDIFYNKGVSAAHYAVLFLIAIPRLYA